MCIVTRSVTMEVVLFHHALGLTPGVLAFAVDMRRAAHSVQPPELFAARTFGTVGEGVAQAQELRGGEVLERGIRAVEGLPTPLAYAGLSPGALPAQKVAQSLPAAR